MVVQSFFVVSPEERFVHGDKAVPEVTLFQAARDVCQEGFLLS